MATCTFFGHRDTSKEIESKLREAIIDLIETKGVTLFYIGTHGNFDKLVRKNLEVIKSKYSNITYITVLSHLPTKKQEFSENLYSNSIYPEGLESTSPKYAIISRNKWMIEKSDYVITYVTHTLSNASKFKEMAEKKGKIVINIA